MTSCGRILVIDDDAMLLRTLSDILRSQGYEVLVASDGAKGLAALEGDDIPVVLVDLMLPDIPGLEVLRSIRASSPFTEVIILTGNASIDSAIEATNKGAFSYLRKPYEIDQLVLHIRRAIEKRRREEEIRRYQSHLEDLVRERTCDLEAAKLRAEAGDRAKTDFIANMSHEIRTPLNAIIGFSEVLGDELFGPLNSKQKEYVEEIMSGGRSLLEMIMNILDYSEAESGRLRLDITRLSLKDLLNSAAFMLRQEMLRRRMHFELRMEPGTDIEIEGDPGKLRQIVLNLLNNAVKFTPDGGSVFLRTRLIPDTGRPVTVEGPDRQEPAAEREGGTPPLSSGDRDQEERAGNFVEISITDTGIGISHEDLPKIFRRFVQLEAPYTKKHRGTGLGLALTRKLVELHGGSLWVESKAKRGSRFLFTIPCRRIPEETVRRAFSETPKD